MSSSLVRPLAETPAEQARRRIPRLLRWAHALRALWAWKARGAEVVPYLPLEVSIEVTNSCNFACSYCRQSDPAHHERAPRTRLEPHDAELLLRRLREGGLRTSMLHWTLDGEPFVNPRFPAILTAAVRHGFTTHHFASNFLLATPERLRLLPRDAQLVITPDFCSDPELFETHRGRPGSWAAILDNLRRCLDDPELAHVRLKVGDMSAAGASDPAELDRRFRELRELLPISPRLQLHRVRISDRSGEAPTPEGARYRGCPHPWFSLAVASNGDVVACCRDLERETVLGNLFRRPLAEIWNGAAYRALRRDLAAGRPGCQSACSGCDMPWDGKRHSLRNHLKVAAQRLLLGESD